MNHVRVPVRRRPMQVPRAPRPRHLRARPGFSLVELIVALLILAIGMLALVGTSVSVTRQMNSGNKRTLAANIAEMRFDSLRSIGYRRCSDITTAGSPRTWPGGVVEGWRIVGIARPSNASSTSPDSAIRIIDSVSFVVRRARPVNIVFQTALTCSRS